MRRVDRAVLGALQALVVVLPLLLGGRHPWALTLGGPLAVALLAVTVRERRRRGVATPVPGVAALAAFAALALATTLPLPPALLGALAPATARLYAAMLPGWPEAAAWTSWRSLALDPYAVWNELGRWSIAAAAFATLSAFPWHSELPDEDPIEPVVARVLLAALGGAVAFAVLALLQQTTGSAVLPWMADSGAPTGRAGGPFVNPNHFAAWLEMLIPVALAVCVAVAGRLRRRLAAAARTSRGMGVRPWRTWVSALIVHQRRLWPPVLGATAVVVMTLAHLATGSRGGVAALLAGLGVTVGGIGLRMLRRSGRAVPRSAPAAVALVLVLASGFSLGLWARVEQDGGGADGVDVGLSTRLAVAAQGLAIVRDHPIFGTGLGSWLHAFRQHQAPPVEGGIWDHAHDDYLELAAETGVLGFALALLFAFALARAVRAAPASAGHEARHSGHERPPGFERSEWRAALADRTLLCWGLAGGITAVLVHSFVEFALRMPANLLLLLVLAALLVLELRPPRDASDAHDGKPADVPLLVGGDAHASGGVPRSPIASPFAPFARGVLGLTAPALLLALIVAAAVPRVLNAALLRSGAAPLSPADALDRADQALAEGEGWGPKVALRLVQRAIDRAPADREAHEALALVLGPGTDGDAAQRRALALEPWSAQVRDALALRLWDAGRHPEALVELEESMARFPYLVSHAYLSPDSEFRPASAPELMRALTDGDTLQLRLATLDDERAAAIERGLTRALDATVAGERRAGIVNDLVTVLQVRDRWDAAAAVLEAEAGRSIDDRTYLARAAQAYLRARDDAAAERALLAALMRTPERGDLYHTLAVDVYGARGDYDTAATVLRAGEENALDMLPVYQGITEVLSRRAASPEARAP